MTPEQIRQRSCTDKVRYPTEIMAIMKAKVLLSRRAKASRLWTYACEHCAGWHLTKRLSSGTCVEV